MDQWQLMEFLLKKITPLFNSNRLSSYHESFGFELYILQFFFFFVKDFFLQFFFVYNLRDVNFITLTIICLEIFSIIWCIYLTIYERKIHFWNWIYIQTFKSCMKDGTNFLNFINFHLYLPIYILCWFCSSIIRVVFQNV